MTLKMTEQTLEDRMKLLKFATDEARQVMFDAVKYDQQHLHIAAETHRNLAKQYGVLLNQMYHVNKSQPFNEKNE